MKYKVCDRCGSHLDYGETCECVKEAEQEERRCVEETGVVRIIAPAVIILKLTRSVAEDSCRSKLSLIHISMCIRDRLCAPECLDAVIEAMRAAHPYEEPAYSILLNHALHRQEVYDMLGELPRPMRPEELAAMSETALNTRIQYVPTGREILRCV